MISTTTTAEGGGWGAHASSSVSSMTQTQQSENSISFVLGASHSLGSEIVKNAISLKLTDSARELLENNPEQFIRNYGIHYVE